MNDLPDLKVLKDLYRKYVGEIEAEPEWRRLTGTAIYRKHTGDLDGAIEAMVESIGLTRMVPSLAKETTENLNYLADLYLLKGSIELAEDALRESIELSRLHHPGLLAPNLWILAGIQNRKGEYREALASAEESRRLSQQEGNYHGVKEAEELIEKIKTHLK
jgi:tetratricopeptide (TPR) repeat protein